MRRVPNTSSQPDFSPNPSYQICNPISSALLLTDAHHEVKTLIVLGYEPSFTWTEQNFLSCWRTLFLFQPLLTSPY